MNLLCNRPSLFHSISHFSLIHTLTPECSPPQNEEKKDNKKRKENSLIQPTLKHPRNNTYVKFPTKAPSSLAGKSSQLSISSHILAPPLLPTSVYTSNFTSNSPSTSPSISTLTYKEKEKEKGHIQPPLPTHLSNPLHHPLPYGSPSGSPWIRLLGAEIWGYCGGWELYDERVKLLLL
jgi:hypothetical protein